VNLFVYGTLMNPDVRKKLLGRTLASQAATLEGYAAIRTRADFGNYPIAVPQQSSSMCGLFLSGLAENDFKKLDAYEGIGEQNCPYFRKIVRVRLENGQGAHASAYVGGKKPRPKLEWSVFDL